MQFIFRGKKVAYSIHERGKGSARLTFTWEGKPVWRSLGEKKKRAAARNASEVIQAWMNEMDAQAPAEPPSPPLTGATWAEWVPRYMAAKQADNREDSRKEVERILATGFPAITGPLILAEYSKEKFRAHWEEVKQGRAAKTQKNWLGYLRAFSQFLEEEEVIAKDFTAGVKTPSRSEFGTHEEIYLEEWRDPLMEALAAWARPIFADLWFTGMDPADLYGLQPRKHFRQVEGRAGAVDWKVWKIRQKEGTRIDLPFPSQLRKRWVARWEECGPEDFLHADGRSTSLRQWRGNFREELYRAQRAAGLPKRDVKCLRHTFTTRHIMRLLRGEKGASALLELRRWLGHAPGSRMIEEIYAKLESQADRMT